MSLAELCGMEEYGPFKNESRSEDDISLFCRNFSSNIQLGVPPFENVSNILLLI